MSVEGGRAISRRSMIGATVAGAVTVLWSVGACSSDGPPAPPRSTPTDGALPPSPDAVDTPATSDKESTASPSSTTNMPPSKPASMSIPTIGVTSRVIELGLQANGEMQVPKGATYDRAGWFNGSPTPGELGPSVLAGHVDGKDGPSVFYRLGSLKSGDSITVTRADKQRVTYRVYETERYAKDAFPTVRVYGNTTTPELRLITCSGGLGPDGHYLDNTVVYARMSGATTS